MIAKRMENVAEKLLFAKRAFKWFLLEISMNIQMMNEIKKVGEVERIIYC